MKGLMALFFLCFIMISSAYTMPEKMAKPYVGKCTACGYTFHYGQSTQGYIKTSLHQCIDGNEYYYNSHYDKWCSKEEDIILTIIGGIIIIVGFGGISTWFIFACSKLKDVHWYD